MMGLPVVIVYQMVMYANDIKVNTAVEWRRATSTVYPNLTVCNTRFFDTRKFPSEISSDRVSASFYLSSATKQKTIMDFRPIRNIFAKDEIGPDTGHPDEVTKNRPENLQKLKS